MSMQGDYFDKNHNDLVELIKNINLLADKKRKTKEEVFLLETKKQECSEKLFNIKEQYGMVFDKFNG